jgi:hypothetical protein
MKTDPKRNQAGQDQSDDPLQSIESGEPAIEGQMRGRDADEQSDKLEGDEEPAARKPGADQDWESGRHQAT